MTRASGLWCWCALALMACDPNNAGTSASDTDVAPEDMLPQPAALATPSGGCPDLSTPGIKTITSNGVSRRFGIYFPEEPGEDMPVIFTWHGLTTSTYNPIDMFVTGFDLDGLAEEKNAVVIVPEAEAISLLGQNILLWGILNNEENDLTLYDDLRSCVAESFDVDLRRVSAWGFSGGALWTSKLLMSRADTLSAAVSASGGVDLEIPLIGDALAYHSPVDAVPTMLLAGGPMDVWPDPSAPIIVFEDATDALQEGLVQDGHYVVRCDHTSGHYLPSNFWKPITRWLLNHTYGAPSPYETGDKNIDGACIEVSDSE